jgi:tetratricopeptide (TPR) repeat protein
MSRDPNWHLAFAAAIALMLLPACRPPTLLASAATAPTTAATAPTPEQVKMLDRAHDLAKQVNDLYGQGKFAQAVPLESEVLQIRKQVLGERDPSSLTALNNLGMLYLQVRDFANAEPLLRQAQELKKQISGDRDASYAGGAGNLAGVYQATQQYAKAEALYKQASEIQRGLVGEQHSDYALTLNHLAMLLPVSDRGIPVFQFLSHSHRISRGSTVESQDV